MASLLDLGMLGIWLWPLIIWSAIWKGIALWRAGRSSHLIWFIFLFIFNTAGVLPIIYLMFFQKPQKTLGVKVKQKQLKRKRKKIR